METRLPLTVEPTQDGPASPSVITIGVFDGVHLGHRQLIDCAVARARVQALRCVAITFDPHPRAVLGSPATVNYLTSLDERKELIRQIGVDGIATLHFDREVASLTAEAFVRELKWRLGLAELWVGPDFALGRNREGTVPALRSLGARLGFAVHTVSPVVLDGTIVSSSSVRAKLRSGEVEAVADLLGRPYSLGGLVQEGFRRGRTLGIPTANLEVDPIRAVPADGVYVVNAVLNGSTLPAVASIGVRPTFGENARNLEVHILDFDDELYGRPLKAEFLHRLRPEARFASISELVAQMYRDIAAARAYHVARPARRQIVDK